MFAIIRKSLTLGVLVCLAAPAFGQESGGPLAGPSNPPPEGSAGGCSAHAGKHVRDKGEGPGAAGPIEGLLDSLNLTDAQRQAIHASLAQIHQQNQASLDQNRPTPEQRAQIRDLEGQLKEAKAAGDETQAAAVKSQLEQAFGPMRAAHEQMRQQVHDAIVAQLTPDQATTFEQKWSERTAMMGKFGAAGKAGKAGAKGGRDGRFAAPRALLHAVMTLDLSTDQRTQIRQIMQDFRAARANGTGPAGTPTTDRRAAFTELKTKIESVLTDTQKTQLENLIQTRMGKHRGVAAPSQPPEPASP